MRLYSESYKYRQVFNLDGRAGISADSIGAKGMGIHTMFRLGLPLPPAFALSIGLCDRYRDSGEMPRSVWSRVSQECEALDRTVNHTFGEPSRPTTFSVRSSGLRSMPGMLDTVLNVEVRDGDLTQLRSAVSRVIGSWSGDRACAYRRWSGLEDRPGTAVIVQAMVFGDRGPDSGSGVAAVDGDRLVGEWVEGVQGDALMSGSISPLPIGELAKRMPHLVAELTTMSKCLQDEFGAPLEIEFTVERGKLFFLQARPAIFPAALGAGRGRGEGGEDVLVSGVAASPGTGSGIAGTTLSDPEPAGGLQPMVLIKETTAPADVPTMLAAAAVVTERGGFTSHAAVICREADIPCVVGCGPGALDLLGRRVAVDGSTGTVTRARL